MAQVGGQTVGWNFFEAFKQSASCHKLSLAYGGPLASLLIAVVRMQGRSRAVERSYRRFCRIPCRIVEGGSRPRNVSR
jgi:hypothetical protein